jgi:hypothetical protein
MGRPMAWAASPDLPARCFNAGNQVIRKLARPQDITCWAPSLLKVIGAPAVEPICRPSHPEGMPAISRWSRSISDDSPFVAGTLRVP